MPTFLELMQTMWQGPNVGVVPESPETPEKEDSILSRSGETFTIPTAWMNAIASNDDKILTRGGEGLKLFDHLLDDDVAMSNFQQRRLAVISKEWEVLPGDESDPRSVEAAEHLKAQLKRISWDRICEKMLYGVWYGYAVGEGLYELGSDGKYWLKDIVIPDRAWFGFTNEGALRFRPNFSLSGTELPANKFWVMRTGASHDFAFYGIGLGHWAYWPIWFKRNVIKFWSLYLEKLGYPTVVGETEDGMTADEKTELMTALVAIGRDRAVRLPEGYLTEEKVKLLEAGRSGAGTSTYKDFITEQNEALMRVILGQPGTSKATPQGIGSGQAEVHADVKAEIVKADSDLLNESFNQTFPKWLTLWNFGPDVAPPRVFRKLEDEEDLNSVAERDVQLHGIGIRRTKESVEETYGEGYELKEIEESKTGTLPGLPAPANEDDIDEDERDRRRQEFAARDVAPLYVYRSLRKPAALLKWARAQGLPNIVPANELHVTVLYSRTPVDWFELSDGWEYNEKLLVAEGGPRKIERFEGGALVLRFASDNLKWSHAKKIAKGASHDFPDYLPHITVGFDPDGLVDLEALEAFTGELEFGPEMFEELDTDFDISDLFRAPVFTARDEDAIDRIASMIADETNPVMMEFGETLQDALRGVESPEAARVALLDAFERMPAERMATIAGLPFVVERMAAEAGIEA